LLLVLILLVVIIPLLYKSYDLTQTKSYPNISF